MVDRKLSLLSLALLGGILAGLALLQINFLFMPIALSILWGLSRYTLYAFIWGCCSIWVGHFWLLALHPLDWIGISSPVSFFITGSIWFLCGIFGGSLVLLWSLIGRIIRKLLFNRVEDDPFFSFPYVIFLSISWGIAEVFLSKSPLFWTGTGANLLPGDIWLAGIARLLGEGGLASIQLMVGWWLWRLRTIFKSDNEWNNLFRRGIILLIFVHLLGVSLISSTIEEANTSVGIWQPAISIREKFLGQNQTRIPNLIDKKLSLAEERGAKFLIAPEGTLMANQKLASPAKIPFLTGGFRWVDSKLRSSLLVFEEGESSFSSAIDKFRLVPLGEFIPEIYGLNLVGLSGVGGIYPGEKNRLLKWSGPDLITSICYEISDGHGIADAASEGGKWILSIANLDPYPRYLQKQYLSLAQLRSIEVSRDLIITSNTGPSALILSNGKVSKELIPFKEEFDVFELHESNTKTPYSFWKEYPLIVAMFLALIMILIRNR